MINETFQEWKNGEQLKITGKLPEELLLVQSLWLEADTKSSPIVGASGPQKMQERMTL